MGEEDVEFTPREKIELLKKQKASIDRQIENFRFRTLHLFISIAVGLILVIGLAYTENELDDAKNIVFFSLLGIGAGASLYTFILLYFKFAFGAFRSNIEKQLLKEGATNLQDTIETDFVTKLVQINFKYLDQYYEQTQSQANKSFLLAAFASFVGLAIITVGIVMMYNGAGDVTPAYVTTAAGVTSEFIAAIFFYLYNQTVSKMSDYHDKLVVTQNISLALKIAEELEAAEKSDTQKQLVDRLSENVNEYLTRK
ncbi:MAG: hypothetical protein CMD96_02860 [Gammaproteobacteria bacterium]|jgi:hypothetical protein|nr:hypothetical protein [Gammaproteobacteria bacterium]HJP17120.1 hypothetical protein [Nitrospinota bacterium]|tara:strand:+ start:751 stop:1515 length:765 start_codon:yes stop_codon:yes gene_type:complete